MNQPTPTRQANARPTRPADEFVSPTAGKVPPHDLGAEGAVLSAAMSDSSALGQIGWLKPAEFYSEPNRRIFEAALYLAESGQTVNVVSIAGRLRDTDRLEQVGGTPYLASLVDALPSVANIEEFAERIRDKARARALLLQCMRTTAQVYEYPGPAVQLVAEHEQAIFDLATDDRSRRTVAVGTVVYDVFKKLQAAAAENRVMTGISTGFERLDRLIAGLHEDELTIVAARPGMGKTSLVLNMLRNIASAGDRENGVALFSCEMPKEQLACRWVCGEARVPTTHLQRPGSLTDREWDQLTAAAKDLFLLPIEIDDTPSIGMVELGGKCRQISAKFAAQGKKLAVVGVDYMQLMQGDQNGSREQEISSLSRGLKRLSKELHIPVIALSQLNRAVETRGGKDKKPQLSDLRESGAIEQDADNIIFIYRDDYYNAKSKRPGIAELIVAKQRSGPTGHVFVRFNAEYTRFDNLAPGDGPDEEER